MDKKISREILKNWKVLVVDDEPDSLEVATRMLKFHGATVFNASNGADGLDSARRHKPDFILSDLSMPELDGWGMLYELKNDRATLEIPVFALTAHAMVGDRERAINAGFHNYLTKPLTPATFMAQLLGLLEGVPHLAEALETGKEAHE
ncbi:MAG: response regulator [Anaerolineales bacterium]|nr:response regulator [Anaerolineales bacterium]